MHNLKNRTFVLAAVAFFYAAQSITGFAQEKKKKGDSAASEHAKQGVALIQAGKPEEAIVEFTKVIEVDPKNPHHYSNRGQLIGR